MAHHATCVRYVGHDGTVRVATFTSRIDAERFAEQWPDDATTYTSSETVGECGGA